MKARSWGALASLLGVLGWAGTAPADAELHKLFPRVATLEAPTAVAGLGSLDLPAEVLAACRADLSDLRLLDESGVQVPFVIDHGAGHSPSSTGPGGTALRRMPAVVLGVKRHETRNPQAPNVTEELYELRSPPPAPEGGIWQLVAETDAQSFVRQLVIQSGTLEKPAAQLAQASLFRLRDRNGERVRVPLPQQSGDRFLVRLTGEGSAALEPRWVFEAVEPQPSERVARVPLSLREQRSQGTAQHFELLRPAGIVPNALRIETTTPVFQRHLEVHDRGQGSQFQQDPLGAGDVFRLPGAAASAPPAGGVPLEELELPLRVARGQWLEASIENGDSPALEALGFSAVIPTPSLVFSLPAAGRKLRLYFGGGRVTAPRYDLERLLQQREGSRIMSRDVSAVRVVELLDNPLFDRTPVLGFAWHAGAAVHQERYARHRQLDIASAPDGLAHIVLETADLAALRPDLGDLRVVDESGRQWPYLLEHAQRFEVVTLQIGAASGVKRSRRSLGLPIAPLAPSVLLLEPSDGFFDRAYRLEGRAEGGDRIELASGRWRRSQGASGPIEIQLSAARVVSLELEVEDGDNSPLDWKSARARVAIPDLYVLAPAGKYRLLLGNPNESAPSYDIGSARELVLSVASAEQVPGPLLDNPGFRATARLTAGDGAINAAVWGALALAVVVLGGLTLRLARQG